MTVRVAMPFAHETAGDGDGIEYADYYTTDGPHAARRFALYRMFNQRYEIDDDQRVCSGLHLGVSDGDHEREQGDGRVAEDDRVAFTDQEEDDGMLDLYALTDGFLSYDDSRLVLRLPRELEHITFGTDLNSGESFYDVEPEGPNLRYVIYDLGVGDEDDENGDDGDGDGDSGDDGNGDGDDGNGNGDDESTVDDDVEEKIRALVEDANHPMRTELNVHVVEEQADGGTVERNEDLSDYIAPQGTDQDDCIDEVVEGFMEGELSLLVEAGDAIGSFQVPGEVLIEFRDSCGSYNPQGFSYHDSDARQDNVDTEYRPEELRKPVGRRINPSYFLWALLAETNRNSNDVDVLTDIDYFSGNLQEPIHPLLDLLVVDVPEDYSDAEIDLDGDVPPPPRNYTVPIDGDEGEVGIPLVALSEWHESRNASDPYDTDAPIQWRVYGDGYTDDNGDEVEDEEDDDVGKLRAQNKARTTNAALPNNFDHDFEPDDDARDMVRSYWADYGNLVNPLAERFDVPCELIVALSCKETGGGHWDEDDRESIVACEPFPRGAPTIANMVANPWDQIGNPFVAADPSRTDTQLLTDYDNFVGNATTNPDPIPVPWAGGTAIDNGTDLTWDELAYLHAKFANNVRYTPGVIQIQPVVASEIMGQVDDYYGTPLFDGVEATVTLDDGTEHDVAVQDPPDDLQDLASDWFGVDHANAEVARKHRAFHSLAAGTAKMRRDYNTSVLGWNLITDFDPPTVASGHNAGADSDNYANDWETVFGLSFTGDGYPRDFPKYYNAAVELFNGEWDDIPDCDVPDPNPGPTVRLWRSLE